MTSCLMSLCCSSHRKEAARIEAGAGDGTEAHAVEACVYFFRGAGVGFGGANNFRNCATKRSLFFSRVSISR